MRLLARLTLALLVLLGVAYLARNLLVREALELGVRRRTGFPLSVEAVDLGLLGGTFDARGLRLLNPPDLGGEAFVELPRLHVDYLTRSLIAGRPRLRDLSVEVKEVRVVTGPGGEKNTARLAAAAGGEQRRAARASRTRYRVDRLRVRVGTVILVDLSHGRRSERRVVLDREVVYRDVTESTDLTGLVLGTVFEQLGPALGGAARGLGDALQGAGSAAGKAGRGLLDVFKGR